METYPFYSGGKFMENNEKIPVNNAFTGEVFAFACKGNVNDLEFAIQQAKSVEKHMKEMPSFVRYRILMQIARDLETDKEFFARILAQEACKPLKYALGEIDRSVATFTAAAEEAKRLPGEYLSIDWTPAGKGKEGWVKYFPIGLVAGIAPFNFPLNLAVHKIAPAIASGCPIILKPSSSTPLSTLLLAQLIDKTELPKGAVSIIPMDRDAGNHLVTDNRIKLITFTGSPEVGWKMKSQAGQKRVVLELGGNAGVIVSDSAQINFAADRCVVGAFSYSGQVCIHTQRIFVQQQKFSEFIQRFLQGMEKLKTGDPLDPETDFSSMIDEKNAIRVSDWIREAVAGGAQILKGGTYSGNYFEPTVLTNTRQEMKVCALEIFGPVVVIEPYDEFEEALKLINSGRYGLQAGVFTDRLSETNLAFSEIETGGVIINDIPTFRVDHMPYGGIKDSGFGREGIKYSIMDMMEPRLLVKNF